ncbi:MAG: indolepyruvate ferredoxin oxidoreductase subunit alpha [Desulfatitalea sp.]
MKSMGEMLLRREPFTEIVMGNTALVRAMVEAGTQVVTAYPGSPTPEIAAAIHSIPPGPRPFYFEFSTNEKVATEVAYGASVNGHLATVFFKSVGLNVAADTFVQLSLMNLLGGMVVVLGDDPGANSSQNEQDNRHYAHLSYTPVFEPADPAEVYLYYKEAAQWSRKMQMPVILRLTTHVCHAKQRVAFQGWDPPVVDRTPRFDVRNGPYIPLPAYVAQHKERALRKLAQVRNDAEACDLNRVVDHHNQQRGVIAMGLPYLSLMEVLQKASSKPDVLKLGIVYPLSRRQVLDFLAGHTEVTILEELDDLVEKEIKALAYDAGLRIPIHGKREVQDWIGEFTPDKVDTVLRAIWPDLLPEKEKTSAATDAVPCDRPPQMCPGCGHRSAFHAIRQALAGTDITVADIGCHTLGYLPPYEMGQLLMCMGASTGIGSGLSLFNTTRKVVVFMGDSTFFHAGLPGIINALHNRHDITMIVMENGTTAMTGHQDHAGSGRNFNAPVAKIPIRRVLEGLGVEPIFEVDTYRQQQLTEMVRQAVAAKGFSVVIARHPCMLKFTREQRRKPNYNLHQVAIDQTLCEQVHACVAQFGCPTFTRFADEHIEINPDLCIGDGSCVQVCPTKAISAPKKIGS